jgi:hypothetical protein
VANDDLDVASFRWRAVPVRTAETLHGLVDLDDARTNDLKLSLKLYHVGELQLDCQQLMMEAPVDLVRREN